MSRANPMVGANVMNNLAALTNPLLNPVLGSSSLGQSPLNPLAVQAAFYQKIALQQRLHQIQLQHQQQQIQQQLFLQSSVAAAAASGVNTTSGGSGATVDALQQLLEIQKKAMMEKLPTANSTSPTNGSLASYESRDHSTSSQSDSETNNYDLKIVKNELEIEV